MCIYVYMYRERERERVRIYVQREREREREREYVYMYRERERERERERNTPVQNGLIQSQHQPNNVHTLRHRCRNNLSLSQLSDSEAKSSEQC